MLVDRATINNLYMGIMANKEVSHPEELEPPEGAVYRSSELCWKVPRNYFARYGMTVLREAFEGMGPTDMLWNDKAPGSPEGYVILMVARWAVIQEGPVLPSRGTSSLAPEVPEWVS